MRSTVLPKFFQSRWRFVVAVGVALLCAASLDGMRRLEIISDPSEMLQTPDPALAELAEDFRIESSDLLVMVNAERSILSPDILTALHTIHLQVQEFDGVAEAWSLWSLRSNRSASRYVLPVLTSHSLAPDRFETTRQQIASHPLARGHLLSADETSTLILVRTTDQIGDVATVERLTHEIESTVARELGKLDTSKHVQGRVTGFPVVHAEIHRLMQRDQYVFNLVGFAAGAALGWFLLRRLAAVACVAVGPLTGVCLTMGVAGYLGVPITIINSTMPLIILIVGYADAIHLVLAIRDHLAEGMPVEEAVTLALKQLWLPCLLTSLTTAVGFGSLMISEVGTIRDFGGLTAFGCLVNFVAVMTVVPIAASYFGDQLARSSSGIPHHTPREPFARTSHFLGLLIGRFARLITVLGACSIVLSLWCAMQLRTSNRLADSVPNDGRTYETYRMCEEKFGGAAELHVRVTWPEELGLQSPQVIDALVAVERAVRAQPDLGPPLSTLDVIRSLPGRFDEHTLSRRQLRALRQLPPSSVDRFLNERRHRALVTARIPDMGVDELRDAMDQLESAIAEQGDANAPIETAVVGQIPSMVRTFQRLVVDLLWSVLLASLVIFSLMTLQFRSWRIGLLSVIPSAFAMLGAAAILFVTGTPLQLASLVCFTICLGISVDDTIHYFSRFRLLRPKLNREDAATTALVHIGPALFITTVVFVVGFGTVMLSQVPVLKTFSWLACICLILALIGDTVVLPAVLVTLSRLSRKSRPQTTAALPLPPSHLPTTTISTRSDAEKK